MTAKVFTACVGNLDLTAYSDRLVIEQGDQRIVVYPEDLDDFITLLKEGFSTNDNQS